MIDEREEFIKSLTTTNKGVIIKHTIKPDGTMHIHGNHFIEVLEPVIPDNIVFQNNEWIFLENVKRIGKGVKFLGTGMIIFRDLLDNPMDFQLGHHDLIFNKYSDKILTEEFINRYKDSDIKVAINLRK